MMDQDLHTLLQVPRLRNLPVVQWVRAQTFWEKLTSGDTLFTALSKAVKGRSLGDAAQLAGEWNEARDKLKDADFDTRWNTVRALVWCAEHAVLLQENPVMEIDSASLAVRGFPSFLKGREEWAWITIRSFLDLPRRPVRVPVVGWDPKGETGGILRTLVLEVFERGAGHIAHHPAQVFETSSDDDFRESIKNAWRAARFLVQQQMGTTLYDGRWQLLEKDAFAQHANGPSAGGAAALGFYHALRNTVPDDGLIVTAAVQPTGELEEVDGIPAKVRAIANAGCFDTIVVAGEDNKTEAEKVLAELKKGEAIRVGTPEELLRHASSRWRTSPAETLKWQPD